MFRQLFGIMQECVVGWGALTDAPKGSRWDVECEGLSCSIPPSIHPSIIHSHRGRGCHTSRTMYVVHLIHIFGSLCVLICIRKQVATYLICLAFL